MTGAALLDFRLAVKSTDTIDRVANNYIVAYGAVARMNVRSIEQGLALRTLLIDRFITKPDAPTIPDAEARLKDLSAGFADEVATARQIFAQEIASSSPFADIDTLARIDERVALAEKEQASYEDRLRQMVLLIRAGDVEALAPELARLEQWRTQFNGFLDETRRKMLEATLAASRHSHKLQNEAEISSLVVLGLAASLTLGTAAILTRGLVRPVRNLLDGTQAVVDGHLDVVLPVTTADEIGKLTETFNRMTDGLRIGARARETFGKYVDPRIVKSLIDLPHLVGEDGERRVMTVMFCDLQGFTAMSESLTPRALVKLMNRYCTLMSQAVRDNEGVIDKFIGDAVMAFWGPPFTADGEQAALASLSALAQFGRLEQLQAELPDLLSLKPGRLKIDMRIGIATGEVVVGSIGSELMRNYTVLGDAVNLASRLEAANKLYGTRILVSQETAARAADQLELREIDSVVVAGMSEPNRIHEVMGTRGSLDPARSALLDRFAAGLDAYRRRDWGTATSAFEAALGAVPDDRPSRLFLERIRVFKQTLLPDDWKGVWIMAGSTAPSADQSAGTTK